jgi:methionyl-tRNA formyltransferase
MNNIVFCGFGNLGKECMKAIIDNGYQISFVLTHKDDEVNSVDTFAKINQIDYSYLDTRKNLDLFIKKIQNLNPEFILSVNYRYIIPKEIFSLAKFSFNIHGSLLPKYRGRTPHVWSIINGENESGITSHLIEEDVDTGDIILQKVIPIESQDTGYNLLKKFESEYPVILIASINKLINGTMLTKQNNKIASFYGKRTPEMGYIDFRKYAIEIINFVRAQAEPYPGAYYYLVNGKKIIINKITIDEINLSHYDIGLIVEIDNYFYVRCKDFTLRIDEYKIEN